MGDGICLLGMKVKQYRRLRTLTLEQLAEKVDVSLNFIQAVEVGKEVPSIDLFIKICEVLGVAPTELLRDSSTSPLSVELKDLEMLPLDKLHLVTTIVAGINAELECKGQTMKTNIGKRLQEIRLLSGKTRKELAGVVGLSPSQLGHIETGTQFTTLKTLVSLADALHTPLEYFLQDESASANLCILNNLLTEIKAKHSEHELIAILKIIGQLVDIADKSSELTTEQLPVCK